MPHCNACNEHYSIRGDKVLMAIYDHTELLICHECKRNFLEIVKEYVEN